MQRCLPRYSFRRLDEKESNRTLYPGLNFRWGGQRSTLMGLDAVWNPRESGNSLCRDRYAKYNTGVNGVEERTLYKAFGIRFDVMVFGQVGLFWVFFLSLF